MLAAMVEIQRISALLPRYEVRDGGGLVTPWEGRANRKGITGEVDGLAMAIRSDGRQRFVLSVGGAEVAAAQRSGRRWSLTAGPDALELHKPSIWRSAMELRRADGTSAGTIRKVRGTRGLVRCEIDESLPAVVQAFAGFVAITVWAREADAAAGGTVAATGGGA
jgi:hypothetical protein